MSGKGPIAGSNVNEIELPGSLKRKEFIDQRQTVKFYKRFVLHGVSRLNNIFT